jgi:hypothetical protein
MTVHLGQLALRAILVQLAHQVLTVLLARKGHRVYLVMTVHLGQLALRAILVQLAHQVLTVRLAHKGRRVYLELRRLLPPERQRM